jgi:hypothetical protein
MPVVPRCGCPIIPPNAPLPHASVLVVPSSKSADKQQTPETNAGTYGEARTSHGGRRQPDRVKAVPIFSLARCLRNLGSTKDAACLFQHHSADTRRSDQGFPDSPGLPNRASQGGTSMVWPCANCALSPEGLRIVTRERLPPSGTERALIFYQCSNRDWPVPQYFSPRMGLRCQNYGWDG